MKEIFLTRGKVALVDDEDYDVLNQYKWTAVKKGEKRVLWYAMRTIWHGSRHGRPYTYRFMHREVVNAPTTHDVDHKDGDGLNNRKDNLRLCDASQNAANKRPAKGKRFKGTHKKSRNRYVAHVRKAGTVYYLGSFIKEEDAARAYDQKAQELYGEFAWLNFPNG